MKKVLLTLAIAIAANFTYGQRIIDQSVRLTSPTANSGIRTGVPFNMTFTVVNNGPDAIKTTDSFIFYLGINNTIVPQVSGYIFPTADIPAGDSTMLQFNGINISGGAGASVTQVCAHVFLLNRSLPDSVKDNRIGGNNVSCVPVKYSGTGIGELTASLGNNFSSSLYPNPANSEITVEFNAGVNQNVTLNVYDMQGKLVKTSSSVTETEGTQNLEMNIGDLNKGVYFYNIIMDGQISSNKFVVD